MRPSEVFLSFTHEEMRALLALIQGSSCRNPEIAQSVSNKLRNALNAAGFEKSADVKNDGIEEDTRPSA